MPQFPNTRLRRNRQTDWNRRLVQEHDLSTSDLIWPLFVHDDENDIPISSLPGQFRWSIDNLCVQAQKAEDEKKALQRALKGKKEAEYYNFND